MDLARERVFWLQNSGHYNNYCWICACFRVSGCFAPGTLIRLADQTVKPIEEIRAGEQVWNPVSRKPATVERIIEGPEKFPLIEYGFDGSVSHVSQKHPVLTGAGIKTAVDLVLNDTVVSGDGTLHNITQLRTLPLEDGQMVINLITEDWSVPPEEQHYLVADGMITGDLILQNELNKGGEQ